GGMSAAHELIERGFEVEVYERQNIPGGKARSIPVFESLDDRGSKGVHGPAIEKWRQMKGYLLAPQARRPWLPGEHGFRFFPNFYRHIIDTMNRIPFGEGKVSDNLVKTSQVFLARFNDEGILLPARFPRSLKDIKSVLDYFLKLLSGETRVPLHEVEFFESKIWQFMTSSEERRLHEYEKIGWWDFVDAGQRSKEYQNFFAHGFTRSLVASQAHLASSFTVGKMHLQLLFGVLDPTIPSSDYLLNGPSNVVWIQPWLNYLEAQGVKYHLNCTVQSINCSGGTVRSVMIENEGSTKEVSGDFYVSALPIERMAPLITSGMRDADPQLGHMEELAKNVTWMNGIQFYLTRFLPIAHGHVIYLDTPWALTSISQGQFWHDFDLSKFSDGDTRDILSVDISDWNMPGLNGKPARECTRKEIADETWEQLKRSLNVKGRQVLRDEDLDHWFLDPDIQEEPEERHRLINGEPLLVNLKDTWRLRPKADTAIPNFFLASDYVQTYTDLATMEAANEAARRAVNGIIEAAGSQATPCRLWKLHEPEILQPLREYDRVRWGAGLPWDERLMNIALSVLEVVQKTSGLPSGKINSPSNLTDSTASTNTAMQHNTDGAPTGAEILLQVSKQILSTFGDESDSTVLPDVGQKEPSGIPVSLKTDSVGPAPANLPRRRGRIRIVQKP
ncbi:MAG: FAD-dependent oxidoreductase, partial [Nitrospira sp.]|nr:FAD-dependent oxidoreductase [Nitrospira sp.]